MYLDLTPVVVVEHEGSRDRKALWMEAHMAERLAEEGGTAAPFVFTEKQEPEVIAAVARRDERKEDEELDRASALVEMAPVGLIPPPSRLRCWHCDAVCLPTRAPVYPPIRLIEKEGVPYFVNEGITCRFPCAAAYLFGLAGGHTSGHSRDESLRYMGYLRLLFYTYTKVWRDEEFPLSPPRKTSLRSHGVGGMTESEYAGRIASLDPYERWFADGRTITTPRGPPATGAVSEGISMIAGSTGRER
jgi:hypothetical protein